MFPTFSLQILPPLFLPSLVIAHYFFKELTYLGKQRGSLNNMVTELSDDGPCNMWSLVCLVQLGVISDTSV
jgi:hypothetical protein